MSNPTIEQEMLEYFTQLNDAEKKSVVNLLATFIKSKEELAVINIDQLNNDSLEIDAQTKIKIAEPKKYYPNVKKEGDNIKPTWW